MALAWYDSILLYYLVGRFRLRIMYKLCTSAIVEAQRSTWRHTA